MKIEVGVSYITKRGENTGPMFKNDVQKCFFSPNIKIKNSTGIASNFAQAYNSDGKVANAKPHEYQDRIVGLWVESNVEKITPWKPNKTTHL